MKGTRILIASPLRGVIEQVIVSGTPKPGTLMTVKAATEPVDNVFTYEAYNRAADGDLAEIAVLLEKDDENKTYDDAYVDGDRANVYFPAMGEHLNVRVSAAGTGESDAQAIGELYIADDGTGLLVATTGSPESEPFRCMETAADVVAAGTLLRCKYTGH